MNIAIVGAGIMGRILAWRLLQAGQDITVYDAHSSSGCSMAAAGLLTPTTELEKNPYIIYELGRESIDHHWIEILSQLNQPIYFKRHGSIVLSHPNDRSDFIRYQQMIVSKSNQLPCFKKITHSEIAALEPALSKFHEAYYFSDEAQIDNQQVFAVLKSALLNANIQWIEQYVDDIESVTERYDLVFDCRGLSAKPIYSDLRGVRGELIWVDAPDVHLTRPVRFLHPRYSIYIVPRPNNIYLIGASEIESDDMGEISVRSTLELLTAAYYVHAGFAEAKIVKTVTQSRPTLKDHLPKMKYNHRFVAVNGLYRHGYLIAPALAADIETWMHQGISAVKYPSLWEKLND